MKTIVANNKLDNKPAQYKDIERSATFVIIQQLVNKINERIMKNGAKYTFIPERRPNLT